MVALQAGTGMKLLGRATVKGYMSLSMATFAETPCRTEFRTLWP